MIRKTATLLLTSFVTALMTISCERERQIPVPYVYVNYTLYLSNPSNYHLLVPGSYLILPDLGNHGIIVYRKSIGDTNDFVAFDLTCTVEPLENCILKMDEEGYYLECPCCGSLYSVWDGLPARAPAKWPLLEYQTSFNGTNLRIYNR